MEKFKILESDINRLYQITERNVVILVSYYIEIRNKDVVHVHINRQEIDAHNS